jgi:hypothetical protein
MIGFIIGLAIGLAVAAWLQYRAEAQAVSTYIAIHNGSAVPDENGNIGWIIK